MNAQQIYMWSPRISSLTRSIAVCLLTVTIAMIADSKEPSVSIDQPPKLIKWGGEGATDNSQEASVTLKGPLTIQHDPPQFFRFCLDADQVRVLKLGDGSLRVRFTGSEEIPQEWIQAWIYPEKRLEPSTKKAAQVAFATFADVVYVGSMMTLPYTTVKNVIRVLKIVGRRGPALFRTIKEHYSFQIEGTAVLVSWNREAVKGSSHLCINIPVVFRGDVPAGVSVEAEFMILDNQQDPIDHLIVSEPWLSLESADHRNLQQRAKKLRTAFLEPQARDAIATVDAVLAGNIAHREQVVQFLGDHAHVPPEVRSLCANLLALVPHEDSNERLEIAARFDPSPATRAASAVSVSGLGRDTEAIKSWIEHYRNHRDVNTLVELFNLLTEETQHIEVTQSIASLQSDKKFPLPADSAFQWMLEQLQNETLSPKLRMAILNGLTPNSISRFVEACSHVITYERTPQTDQLRTECFKTIANLSEEHAQHLLQTLYTRGGEADRCLALTLLLGDGPRQPLQETMRILTDDLLSSPGSDTKELIGCATQQEKHRDHLLPYLMEALEHGSHTSVEVHAALASAGLESQIPRLFLEVARSAGVSRSVRQGILNHLLGMADPASPSPDDPFVLLSGLLEETLSSCNGQSCRELLGVPHAELELNKLADLLLAFALGEQYSMESRKRALAAMVALGESHKRHAYQAIVDQVANSSPADRRSTVEVVATVQLADLIEATIDTLCSLAEARNSGKGAGKAIVATCIAGTGTAIGVAVAGPPGAIIGGLVGGLFGLLVAFGEPACPTKPSKPDDFIDETWKRPTNRTRATVLGADGKTTEVWLCNANVSMTPTATNVTIDMRCAHTEVKWSLFDEPTTPQSDDWRTNDSLRVTEVQASSSQPFNVKIEVPDKCDILVGEQGATESEMNQNKEKALFIQNVREIEFTGEIDWQKGNSVDVHACEASGRAFYSTAIK
jgi:hypothetical protein